LSSNPSFEDPPRGGVTRGRGRNQEKSIRLAIISEKRPNTEPQKTNDRKRRGKKRKKKAPEEKKRDQQTLDYFSPKKGLGRGLVEQLP